MDQSTALYKKTKGRDLASYAALSDQYGWKLYSYIRKNTEDREAADRIFSQAFSHFYDSMEKYNTEDPVETMLYVYADQAANLENSVLDVAQVGTWKSGSDIKGKYERDETFETVSSTYAEPQAAARPAEKAAAAQTVAQTIFQPVEQPQAAAQPEPAVQPAARSEAVEQAAAQAVPEASVQPADPAVSAESDLNLRQKAMAADELIASQVRPWIGTAGAEASRDKKKKKDKKEKQHKQPVKAQEPAKAENGEASRHQAKDAAPKQKEVKKEKQHKQPSQQAVAAQPAKKESAGMKIFYIFCILLLLVGITLSIWAMIGMLMNMNLIPYVDLGYKWFNANVFNAFR